MTDTTSKKLKKASGKHRFTVFLNDPKVKRFADTKVNNEFDGNMSLYVRTLIRRDMAGKVAA